MPKRLHVLSLLLMLLPGMANAQDMRRCQRSDGSIVYTDRQCESGQNERPADTAAAPQPKSARAAMTAPPACSASAEDLLYNVRIAIDSHDVNLLARSYHWPGLGDAQVESILNRLDVVVQRPLVDIRLVYPEPVNSAGNMMPDPDIDSAVTESDLSTEHYTARSAPAPYGLKVQQYAASNSNEILGVRFGLHRHFNCWWIRY